MCINKIKRICALNEILEILQLKYWKVLDARGLIEAKQNGTPLSIGFGQERAQGVVGPGWGAQGPKG